MSEMIGNTVRDAVVGGTISVIGGGKFANGAQTGAFRYLFNDSNLKGVGLHQKAVQCHCLKLHSFG
jgi:hypothetical protein